MKGEKEFSKLLFQLGDGKLLVNGKIPPNLCETVTD